LLPAGRSILRVRPVLSSRDRGQEMAHRNDSDHRPSAPSPLPVWTWRRGDSSVERPS
jgi:hypothetical protein